MREVLFIIWTLTTELESGMFNGGGGLKVDAIFELRCCTYFAQVIGMATEAADCQKGKSNDDVNACRDIRYFSPERMSSGLA